VSVANVIKNVISKQSSGFDLHVYRIFAVVLNCQILKFAEKSLFATIIHLKFSTSLIYIITLFLHRFVVATGQKHGETMERTFVMIKPDGVQRGLIGKVVSRLEERGLKIIAMKIMMITREQAEKQYRDHKGEDYYEPLLDFMTSSPVVAMVVEGREAIKQVRLLIGEKDPLTADPGTVRFDFAQGIRMNIVHSSDKKESAEFEIGIYFKEHEMLNYKLDVHRWIFVD